VAVGVVLDVASERCRCGEHRDGKGLQGVRRPDEVPGIASQIENSKLGCTRRSDEQQIIHQGNRVRSNNVRRRWKRLLGAGQRAKGTGRQDWPRSQGEGLHWHDALFSSVRQVWDFPRCATKVAGSGRATSTSTTAIRPSPKLLTNILAWVGRSVGSRQDPFGCTAMPKGCWPMPFTCATRRPASSS